MANQIMTTNNVPLAVINGALGGQTIAFFQRNDANHLDPNTNYGRTLRRLQKAGVAGAIRTILFYQGESDGNNGASIKPASPRSGPTGSKIIHRLRSSTSSKCESAHVARRQVQC